MMARSPIKWVGGKSRLAKQIIALLPAHRCYVEPFGGAMHVLFAKAPSKVEVYNDLDGELVNFFRVVKHRHEELIRDLDWVLVGRETFEDFKTQDVTALTEVERAARFYYLVNRSFGAKYADPILQTSKEHDVPGNHIRDVEEIITQAYRRLTTVMIEHGDFATVIGRYDGPETVFYCDPPYLGNQDQYPQNMTTIGEHLRLAETLADIQGRFLLTVNDCPEFRKLYADHYIREVGVNYSVSLQEEARREWPELIITNYAPAEANGPLFATEWRDL